MRRPPPRRRFAASRNVLNVPLRLTAMCRSKLVSSVSAHRSEVHDAGVVDQHVDSAECRLCGVEHPPERARIADVGLRPERPAAGLFDRANQRLGRGGILGIIDDEGEAVVRGSLCKLEHPIGRGHLVALVKCL